MPGEIDGVEVGIEQVDFGAILEDEIDRNHREGELEAHDERRREVEVWRAVPDRGADATAASVAAASSACSPVPQPGIPNK